VQTDQPPSIRARTGAVPVRIGRKAGDHPCGPAIYRAVSAQTGSAATMTSRIVAILRRPGRRCVDARSHERDRQV
jgi:hypothetical protein